MSGVARRLRAGFLRDARVDLSYPLFIVFSTVVAFFSPLLFYFVARFVGEGVEDQLSEVGGDYFAFVLVGLIWASFIFVATRTYTSVLREAQLTGLLEALVQTPTRGWVVLISQGVWPYAVSLFHAVVILGVSVAALGVHLDIDPLGVLAVAVVSAGAVMVIGLGMGAVVLVVKRGEGIVGLVGSALVLLGGLYYPAGTLPVPLDTMASIVPISHAVDALRQTLLTGAGIGSVADDLLPVVIFAVVGLPLAAWAVEAALDACRRAGTLGRY